MMKTKVVGERERERGERATIVLSSVFDADLTAADA